MIEMLALVAEHSVEAGTAALVLQRDMESRKVLHSLSEALLGGFIILNSGRIFQIAVFRYIL
jgi:hypothetical protein